VARPSPLHWKKVAEGSLVVSQRLTAAHTFRGGRAVAAPLRESISGSVKRSGGALPAPSPPRSWEVPESWGSASLARRASLQKQGLLGRHLRR